MPARQSAAAWCASCIAIDRDVGSVTVMLRSLAPVSACGIGPQPRTDLGADHRFQLLDYQPGQRLEPVGQREWRRPEEAVSHRVDRLRGQLPEPG
jgi:hypothetical protein